MKHVLCVGNANIDHTVEVADFPSREGKEIAEEVRWGGGGIAATAAVAAAALGARVTWVGLIGDDAPGRSVAGMLTDAGVTVGDKTVVPGAKSPVAVVVVNGRGERWIAGYLGENLDPVATPPQLPDLREVDVVLGDTLFPALTREAFLAARAAGRPRVLDLELFWSDEILEVARLADHVVCSEEGLARATGITDVPAGLAAMVELLTPGTTVAVTVGEAGSLWWTPDGPLAVPAFPVVVKDTNGCGDTFHGAYALAVAEGRPMAEAARFASATAALKAERGMGWDGMPDRALVERLLT